MGDGSHMLTDEVERLQGTLSSSGTYPSEELLGRMMEVMQQISAAQDQVRELSERIS